jgi:hypothetical protein
VTTSPATKRTWIALGIAQNWFFLTSLVCAVAALAIADATMTVEAGDLSLVASMGVVGAVGLVVGVPVGVHTSGRLTDYLTRPWGRARSALAHLAVGAVWGAAVAAVVVSRGSSTALVAFVAFVLPPALTGYLTHLVVPSAVTRPWMPILAWVLAVPLMIGAAIWCVWALAVGL